jgi:hypothetical protein
MSLRAMLPIATTPDRPGRVYRRNGGALSLLEALLVVTVYP